MKRALITGITGQDGSYLADLLLSKGYQVAGMVREASVKRYDRIEHILNRIEIFNGDLEDQGCMMRILQEFGPDEVYNLAAMSFVPYSWQAPVMTAEVTGLGAVRMLEAIRLTNPKIRFYQASTSEMYGLVRETPQNEMTPFHPRSPYGVAKVYGHYITQNYRESYDMYACSGILFNHEGPRRGTEFVTRKVTRQAARIKLGLADKLALGNLDAKRDWGDARDYVEAMWLMLQQDKAEDYVIGTGETRSVRDLVVAAFDAVGIDNWEDYIEIDPRFLRPAEVELLLADPTKAKTQLGWVPRISFKQMIKDMVETDLAELSASEAKIKALESRIKALEAK